jgi:hypothetical protein
LTHHVHAPALHNHWADNHRNWPSTTPTSSSSDNTTTKSDDDSFDKLLPRQSRQRQIGPNSSYNSDDEPDGRDYVSDDFFSTASDGSLLHDLVEDEFGRASGDEDSVCVVA